LSSIQVTPTGTPQNPNELVSQSAFNYQYNEIGQLTADSKAQISGVVWNVYGKILSLIAGSDTITFTYDAASNRISKKANGITTWYVRDAQGNVISVYTQGNPAVHGDSLSQTEADVYGSSRLGLLNLSLNCISLSLPDSGSLVRGNKLFELTNHLGNVLETISDKKIQHTSDNSTVDYYLADVIGANDYYSFGMEMPGRGYALGSAGSYRYGFNGKEQDPEVKGPDNQYDYGMRMYDPRVGRFLSVDPLASKYPFYSPYEFAGNCPIEFTDLDGAEPKVDVSQFWTGQPLINMTNAEKIKGYNAQGVPRAANWFFQQQLKAKPEMFSETNKLKIAAGKPPIADEQWIKFNPTAAPYENQKLWHHHVDGGELAAAIPEGLNNDYFSELHPYINAGKALQGEKVTGLLGGATNIIGTVGMFTGLFTGDPDSWINAFGFGEPSVGDIKRIG
jgi:RHS repeat-associated protein